MRIDRPTLKLIGQDGNAFAILAAARGVMKRHGNRQEQIDRFMTEALSAHLLRTCLRWFEVS